MSTYKNLNIIINSGKSLFTTAHIKQLLNIESNRTLEDFIKRLIDQDIFTQLEKGKYLLKNTNTTDFEVAQFLYSPSYISFETALNYHGVLSQFPVEISSATTKNTETKEILGKIFSYSKLSTKLFTGYYKEGSTLIAYPEKAIFDQMYMISKGIKTEQYLDEMDYSNISKRKLEEYLKLLPTQSAKIVDNMIHKYL